VAQALACDSSCARLKIPLHILDQVGRAAVPALDFAPSEADPISPAFVFAIWHYGAL
jgi:hypothetical protein